MIFKQPKNQSKRILKKFAFLPITVCHQWNGNETRWLTYVTVKQTYHSRTDSLITDIFGGEWINDEFVDNV